MGVGADGVGGAPVLTVEMCMYMKCACSVGQIVFIVESSCHDNDNNYGPLSALLSIIQVCRWLVKKTN